MMTIRLRSSRPRAYSSEPTTSRPWYSHDPGFGHIDLRAFRFLSEVLGGVDKLAAQAALSMCPADA
jgi:hypothetical protein